VDSCFRRDGPLNGDEYCKHPVFGNVVLKPIDLNP
jgi:hypothetical protein